MTNTRVQKYCASKSRLNMKNDIDSKMILNVFEFIQQHGEAIDGGKMFEGITAFTDFDGYTVYLKTSTATISLGFHNTYHLDYELPTHKEMLINSIHRIQMIASAQT